MSDFEKNNDEIWVFLSHSNKDFDKVRILRNKMEEKGLRPLMFFLKCLDSDPEIFELLKREIDVRPRFFLCESENSKSSVWVQREIEYILSKDRQYITVDLNDIDSFDEKIQEIKRRSQVFLSYSLQNNRIAKAIGAAIQKRGLNVFDAEVLDMMPLGVNFYNYIQDKISKICQNGYFMPIITENNMRYVLKELRFAMNTKETFIIPVLAGNNTDDEIRSIIAGFQYLVLDVNALDESINQLCDRLLYIDRRKNK